MTGVRLPLGYLAGTTSRDVPCGVANPASDRVTGLHPGGSSSQVGERGVRALSTNSWLIVRAFLLFPWASDLERGGRFEVESPH